MATETLVDRLPDPRVQLAAASMAVAVGVLLMAGSDGYSQTAGAFASAWGAVVAGLAYLTKSRRSEA